MASSGKPKTTFAKLQREAVLRERRVEKAARKRARKDAQMDPGQAAAVGLHAVEGTTDPVATDTSVSATSMATVAEMSDEASSGRIPTEQRAGDEDRP